MTQVRNEDSTRAGAKVTARVASAWRKEHENFGFLLNFLEHQTASFREGDRSRFDLVLDVLAHLNFFAEHYHALREEAALDYLVQKDPASRRAVGRLLLEHRVVFAKGKKVYDMLGESSGVASTEGMTQLAKYVRYFRHHLAVEERSVLPRAEAMLSEPEWNAVQNAAPPGPQPFRQFSPHRYAPSFGDEAEEGYLHLHARITHLMERMPRGILERRSRAKSRAAEVNRTPPPAASLAPSKADSAVARAGPFIALVQALGYMRPYRQALLLLALVLSYLQYYFLDVNLQVIQLPEIVFYFFDWGPAPAPS